MANYTEVKKKQYNKKVKPRLEEVVEWCKEDMYLTNAAICNRLEINNADLDLFIENEKEFRLIMDKRPKYLKRGNNYLRMVKPYLKDIEDWVDEGLTIDRINSRLGISNLISYKKDYPELNTILEKHRIKTVETLKKTLIERAIGFEREEIKQVVEKYGEGAKAKVKTKIEKTKKFIYSDNCLLFALKNLAPDEFSDFQKQELNISNDGFIEALKATADEVWRVEDENITDFEKE